MKVTCIFKISREFISTYMTLPFMSSIAVKHSLRTRTKHKCTDCVHVLYHVKAILNAKKYCYLILLHSYYTTFFLMTTDSNELHTDSLRAIYLRSLPNYKAIGYTYIRQIWSIITIALFKILRIWISILYVYF